MICRTKKRVLRLSQALGIYPALSFKNRKLTGDNLEHESSMVCQNESSETQFVSELGAQPTVTITLPHSEVLDANQDGGASVFVELSQNLCFRYLKIILTSYSDSIC